MATRKFSASFVLTDDELAVAVESKVLPYEKVKAAREAVKQQIRDWVDKQPKGISGLEVTPKEPSRRKKKVTCTSVLAYELPKKK